MIAAAKSAQVTRQGQPPTSSTASTSAGTPRTPSEKLFGNHNKTKQSHAHAHAHPTHRWTVGETVEVMPRNPNDSLPDFGVIVGLNDDGTYNMLNILNGCWRRFVSAELILGNGDHIDQKSSYSGEKKTNGSGDDAGDMEWDEELGRKTGSLERFEDEL